MGTATIDLETTKNQARKLLGSRTESITDLTLARKRVEELREELAEAECEGKKAYVRATKDGWSDDELKKLGLEAGGVAKRRSRRTSGTSEDDSNDSSTAEPVRDRASAGSGKQRAYDAATPPVLV